MASPKIHVHVSSSDAFYVNSFIIEGDRSLTLVETQFVLSEAEVLAGKIDALKACLRMPDLPGLGLSGVPYRCGRSTLGAQDDTPC